MQQDYENGIDLRFSASKDKGVIEKQAKQMQVRIRENKNSFRQNEV